MPHSYHISTISPYITVGVFNLYAKSGHFEDPLGGIAHSLHVKHVNYT